MGTASSAPVDALEHVSEAESRLFLTIRAFDDATMRSPSLLPDWSVGHLLSHLARNADSVSRRTVAAIEGVVVDQYPGGMAERVSDIEAGAGRHAASIIEDVAMSSARMLEGLADVPDYAWAGITRDTNGLERPLAELPGRRWQEVEVHLIDLGNGPTHRDWSDAFIAARLPDMRAGLAARLTRGVEPPPEGTLDERDELVWLYGRSGRGDLPGLSPWS